MKVIIAGSTGMVGGIVFSHCLTSEAVTEVVSFVRRPTGESHPKLTEVVVEDFADYSAYDQLFQGARAAFFCLGVYTGQVSKELFKTITLDFAVAFAKALEQHSPGATICLLSGAGADRTEKSKTAFALYKGMAENQIASLNLAFHSFRPGYIYPVEKRAEPNIMYRITRSLYPLLRLLGPNASIRSTELGDAIFRVGLHGADQQILENRDILRYSDK